MSEAHEGSASGRAGKHRRNRLAVALIASLLVIATVWIVRSGTLPFTSRSPTIQGKASIAIADLTSPAGRQMVDGFNALGRSTLQAPAGRTAFLTVEWTAEPRTDPACQLQIAISTPSDWRLFGWSGRQPVSNAAINAWGDIVKHSSGLTFDMPTLVVEPPVDAGMVVAVWHLPDAAPVEPVPVRVFVVYACGGNARTAVVQQIHLTS